MKDKNTERIRRSRRTRHQIKKVEAVRLTVHRSNTHIYAQVIDATGSKVLASASTVEPEVRKSLKNGGNVAAAAVIGKRIAEKAKQAGVEAVDIIDLDYPQWHTAQDDLAHVSATSLQTVGDVVLHAFTGIERHLMGATTAPPR